MTVIPGVGSPAKRHVALDVEFAPSFVDNKVSLNCPTKTNTNTNTNTNENTKHKYKHEYIGIKANYNCIFYHQ